MKSFLLLTLNMNRALMLLMVFSFISCSGGKQPQRDENGRVLKNGQFYDYKEKENNEVWLCMGKTSHAYHSNSECYGIKACGGDIKKVPLSEAIEMGRTPCRYCHEAGDENAGIDRLSSVNTTDIVDGVYVCSSSSASRYHWDRDCSGLNRCSGEVVRIDKEDAETRGYTPCKRCYY